MGLEKTQAISRIRIHPTNPDVVFVAALGNPVRRRIPNAACSASKDGGKAWERVLFRDDKTGAVDLVMDPKNPDVLYAALWEVFRTPHSLSSGGPGSGLFKTTDGGTTWTELTKNAGLPTPIWGKVGIAVSGADSNRLFAIIEAKDGGIFMSDDAGATLEADQRRPPHPAARVLLLAHLRRPEGEGHLLRPQHRALSARSTRARRCAASRCRTATTTICGSRRTIRSGWPTPTTAAGTSRSTAARAGPASAIRPAQFYNVFTTTHVPYHVCGAQQDNSTACVSSTGTGDDLYDVGGGESGYIAPDPLDTNVFYAGSYGGLLTRINRRTGEERAINVWPDNPMGHASGDMTQRFQWTFPIVISPTDPKTVYVTSQHVWKSTNEGQSWQQISPDLSRHDPSTMGDSGGPITLDQTGVETYAVVFALAPSPLDGNVIWAGSDDGLVHVTRDGGKNWTKVTPPGLPDFARVSLIEASPHDAGTAYLAANRYQRADRAPYVYRTTDYGATWTKIVNGIRPDDFARVDRRGPEAQGAAVPRHRDRRLRLVRRRGACGSRSASSCRRRPSTAILVKNDDLVIGTHGRVVLRDGQHQRAAPDRHGARPTSRSSCSSRATRRARCRAASPIDYFLKQPADKVTIEIPRRRRAR